MFSTSPIVAINSLEELWSPTLINGKPADRKYTIEFRYRIYLEPGPVDLRLSADKALNEQNYKKALKLFDRAIKDNEYDYELFELRAKVKEALGDKAGSEQDLIN